MTTVNMPAIGAYCLARDTKTIAGMSRTVFQVKAIRGKVSTSAGQLVPPSPTITIENVKTHDRLHMSLVSFHRDYYMGDA